jgi:hypothetical protein
MGDVAYYRGEARRCRNLAAAARDSDAKKRWSDLADDYEQLAAKLERRNRPPPPHAPVQQQPMQQQQQKSSKADDET